MREGWTYKKLGELTTSISGLWEGKKPPFVQNVFVIRNANFTKDFKINTSTLLILDVEEKQFNNKRLQKGDIIIEKSGGSDKIPVGRPVLFNLEGGLFSFSNFTSVLRIKDNNVISPTFLHKSLCAAYLRGETKRMQSKTTGIHNLDMKEYNRLPIPVPPLSVQQSIVSELDMLSGLIAKHEEQLKAYDELAQSIFYDMFGDPVENEKGWEVKKLGEVCTTSSGGTPSTQHKEYYEGGTIPWLRSGEVSQGFISTTELFITELGMNNSSAKYFPINTVVVAMYGATVGQVGVLQKEMTTNQAVCGILPTSELCPTYLYFFLMAMKPFYLKNAAGGAQPNISQGVIKNTRLALPPLSLQTLFAEKIKAIERQKERIRQSMAEVKTLFDSRMDYYFN